LPAEKTTNKRKKGKPAESRKPLAFALTIRAYDDADARASVAAAAAAAAAGADSSQQGRGWP
jgi:hypothetical protein